MRYLTPADLEYQIRNDVLAEIKDGSTTRFNKAELSSYNIMKSYLNKRYDVSKIFYPVYEYKEDNDFVIGQLVYYKKETETEEDYKVYECLQDNSGNPPDAENSQYWELSYKRNPMIIMYLGDITLYHFYSADTAGFTLEHVEKRYKTAMQWLKDVGNGDMIADLPQLATEEGFDAGIRWKSQPKENNRW